MSIQHSPQKAYVKLEDERKKVLQTQPKVTNHHYSYSFATTQFQPSQVAVHPKDNTSDAEPNQPGISMALHSHATFENEPSLLQSQSIKKTTTPGQFSQGGKTTNTFKSQDDIEPEMPHIASEFQSKHTEDKQNYEEDYVHAEDEMQDDVDNLNSSIATPQLNKSYLS